MSSDLQNKLFHFEADPPGKVWDEIADALDNDTELSFPERLFNYEENPPVQSWQNIEAALEESNTSSIKVIPLHKFRKQIGYIAAAASILIAVFFISTFSDKKTSAGAVIGGTEKTVTTDQSSVVPFDLKKQEHSNGNMNDVASIEEENKATQPNTKRTASKIRPLNIFRSISFSKKFIPDNVNKDALFDFSALDNYMVYSDGDGNAMKLPKKLFSFVNCKDGDGSCKERIQLLQQKLATNATTTDFTGVLEILRQLQ